MTCISNMKHIFPKYLAFGNCPICGQPYPPHAMRVIRLFSSYKKGKYVVWCKNRPFKLTTLKKEF